jgi:hypothetical protein
MSSQSQSDTEENENAKANSIYPMDQIEIVKHEIDVKEEEVIEDICDNSIIISNANLISTKERRESKEKSKKELEEEEREKMQYVFYF